ncbi:sodium- and chloride-dependent glycine transporter 1-like [Patiria miniata]|uniref:Transporter n=1 Tax=Patiria miniata TaxID=46514 RepID=A0A913ZVJ5_PATMI|nr:sodium- and chloride-dependent glycine transporter 1-like [Patiria miniata]XP_038055566.1 sodium- and chloride-dependent glycine transporter 1-like [Patiria miniata]XP_038055567.1 sodium- and chloride-dependent glycine transporter 1-like [Patiria miniata]
MEALPVDDETDGKGTEPTDEGTDNDGNGGEDAGGRGNWSGKLDFLLSCVSYAVGLGNIWRFPILCFENGGGAFLLPYVIMMLVVGMPVFFLEMAMGQFSSLGCLNVWKCTPIAKGLGYGMLMIAACIATYYNVIIAYTLFYLFASFTKELPWKTCDNSWNTPNCRVSKACKDCDTYTGNDTYLNSTYFNGTFDDDTFGLYDVYDDDFDNSSERNVSTTRPSEEYFNLRMLDVSDGIHELGEIKWELTLCLLLAWILVFLSLAKGIQSSGKVVYVTSTFPYLVLISLFIRGITLDGAIDGVIFYMNPNPTKLLLPKVWQDAAVQVFFSLGCSFGTLHTLSSYNKFHHNTLKDAVIVSWLDCLTSIFGGFVVFSVLGFMAQDAGTTVDKVVDSGPGLAFIAYPEAIARMPLAPLWSVLFFVMIFMLGIGSEFTLFEAVLTGLVDDLEKNIKNFRKYKTLLTLGLCIICFLLGLPMVTQGGVYIVTLLNTFVANVNLLIVSTTEIIVVAHCYGINRFLVDMKAMLGFKLNIYWKISWWIVSPIALLCVTIASIVLNTPLKYGDGTPYPDWAQAIGWLIAMSTLVPALVYPMYYIYGLQGTILERIRLSVKPTPDWGPALDKDRVVAGYAPLSGTDPQEYERMVEQANDAKDKETNI